jgi:hypothetical protein
VKFPALPGQKVRTQRVLQAGLVGTKAFNRIIIRYGVLLTIAVLGFGVLGVLQPNGILQVIGILFILAGFFMIWSVIPIIRLHFVKRRER